MDIKEELEILRGEPIKVSTGDPMVIPCIETSDPEKLCKHPVVSVHMITYNHEPYIRQAIEGVMMQKTDFEFELIIGEDCSQDKTREICFEYQRKYPDKIRVLWWHENVSKLGGNGRRCTARCRGEFVAFCEGDDYWTDPLKLQKQVDAMRKHPSAGLCFCRSRYRDETGEFPDRTWGGNLPVAPGLIMGKEFFMLHAYGVNCDGQCGDIGFLMTATVMLRRKALESVRDSHDIFKWRLSLGDTTLWLGISAYSDVYYLDDIVAVYRQTAGGACKRNANMICIDGQLARIYWMEQAGERRFFGLSCARIFVARFFAAIATASGQKAGNSVRDVVRSVNQIFPIIKMPLSIGLKILAFLSYLGLPECALLEIIEMKNLFKRRRI